MKILKGFIAIFLLASAAAAQQSDRDRGIDLYREGKFAEAIAFLETSVAANENDRAAWIFLGGAYIHVGEEGKASKAFARTSEIKQPAPPPRYQKTVKVLNRPRPSYTEEARRKLSSGTIRVAVEFRANGTLGFVFALPTTNLDLVQPSLDAAKGVQFEPAVKDGKPVTTINLLEYSYSVR